MLLRLDQIEKSIGGRVLFREVNLAAGAGDRIGLVGPNGAGKSTLLRIAAGDEPPDGGNLSTPRNVRIGMLRQEIDPTHAHSVREEAATAFQHLDALEAELRALEETMAREGAAGHDIGTELADRYDRASSRFEHEGGFEREARIGEVLAGLGFDEEACARPLSSFSGGWLMRVELAKLLLSAPDVLLLDEPTNHLDLPSIQWFEASLESFRGAVVTVSHDRTFLRRHVSRVVELDGFGRCTVYEGNYDRYLAQREERQTQLLARKANQDREIAQMERFVERFRAKATKARQAQSRIKALDRIERITVASDQRRRIRLKIPAPPRSGQIVMKLDGIRKAYDEKLVYAGIDLQVQRGDRVALVGPNGAGKSTLLRILAGTLPFDGGERTIGHNVEVAYFAQHQLEALDPNHTVLQGLEQVAHTADHPRLRGHLGAFLFSGDDVDKRVSVLSGGEKARLALARMLLHPANLLILDEPTNHLDIEACEVLEDALGSFEGTMVLVSHDRSFINALASRVVEVLGGGLREFLGNYDDYLRAVDAEAPAAPSATPAPTPAPAPAPSSARSPASAPAPARARPAGPEGKQSRALDRQRKKARERLARQIEKLEATIGETEERREALGWQLGDPETFKDPEKVRDLNAARDGLQGEIDDLYREWERLADELQALEDAPQA